MWCGDARRGRVCVLAGCCCACREDLTLTLATTADASFAQLGICRSSENATDDHRIPVGWLGIHCSVKTAAHNNNVNNAQHYPSAPPSSALISTSSSSRPLVTASKLSSGAGAGPSAALGQEPVTTAGAPVPPMTWPEGGEKTRGEVTSAMAAWGSRCVRACERPSTGAFSQRTPALLPTAA